MLLFPLSSCHLVILSNTKESPSQRPHAHRVGGRGDLQGITQRPAKQWHVDLEQVAIARLKAGAEADAIRAKEVNVDIAGSAEEFVLEVVLLQVGDRVAHIRLASLERAAPNDRSVAPNANLAAHRI